VLDFEFDAGLGALCSFSSDAPFSDADNSEELCCGDDAVGVEIAVETTGDGIPVDATTLDVVVLASLAQTCEVTIPAQENSTAQTHAVRRYIGDAVVALSK